jgi:hypothetical protein
MHGHPTIKVKNAKPPSLSSKPGPQIRLSEQYLRERNEQMRSKNLTAQMLLAKARVELILRTLVEKQAAYLLVSLRQKILGVPDQLCRRIVNLSDPAQARRILRKSMLSLLNELQDLPSQIAVPNWLQKIEEKDDA